MQTRTLTTAKGRSVTTSLTDQEAIDICAGLNDAFAVDLAIKYVKGGLTPDQMTWAHIKANPTQTPMPAPSKEDFSNILDMFRKAGKTLKAPRIKLDLNGSPLVLTQASNRGRNSGHIYVTNGGKNDGSNIYYGKIAPNGAFLAQPGTDRSIMKLLCEFDNDPAYVAKRYGQLTGFCCFCSHKLTDKRSVDVGYGPICADNFCLPWG